LQCIGSNYCRHRVVPGPPIARLRLEFLLDAEVLAIALRALKD